MIKAHDCYIHPHKLTISGVRYKKKIIEKIDDFKELVQYSKFNKAEVV